MESSSSRKASESKNSTNKGARERRETIPERRLRVMGTTSLRFSQSSKQGRRPLRISRSAASSTADQSPNQGPTAEAEPNRRRRQVLQAQRAHRQRTLDYIDELEAEIFRLRASATTAVSSDVAQPHCNQPPQTALKIITNINVNVLIQSFNGQIAPGIFTCVYPGATGPSNMDGDLANDVSFSENIAPTLVAINGASNGYRALLLPLACADDLVRSATVAASANQLRFQRPKLAPLASKFQSAAIEKLSVFSRAENASSSTRSAILAAIILLMITDMMNGGHQFHLLLNMAKSWIEAMKHDDLPTGSSRSALEQFLLNQLDVIQLYAEPLLKEQYTILAQYEPDDRTFKDRIVCIFQSLEEAIKQACNIYSYHVLHDSPPPDIEEILDNLKTTAEEIPAYAPGENALAWVYFIAAAESCIPAKRTFFSKRLMGIFERGNFNSTTTAFVILHHIWNCQEVGDNWTKTLKDTPSVLVLK
ncbi:hypothetical protein FP744_10000171 [Trichoderma asperellum]